MTRRICRPQNSCSLAPITRDPMKLCRWTPNHREQRTKHSIKGENSLKGIGPLTHCRVSDHLFVVGRNNSFKNGENWLSGVTVVSRHVGVNWKSYCARPFDQSEVLAPLCLERKLVGDVQDFLHRLEFGDECSQIKSLRMETTPKKTKLAGNASKSLSK